MFLQSVKDTPKVHIEKTRKLSTGLSAKQRMQTDANRKKCTDAQKSMPNMRAKKIISGGVRKRSKLTTGSFCRFGCNLLLVVWNNFGTYFWKLECFGWSECLQTVNKMDEDKSFAKIRNVSFKVVNNKTGFKVNQTPAI